MTKNIITTEEHNNIYNFIYNKKIILNREVFHILEYIFKAGFNAASKSVSKECHLALYAISYKILEVSSSLINSEISLYEKKYVTVIRYFESIVSALDSLEKLLKSPLKISEFVSSRIANFRKEFENMISEYKTRILEGQYLD